MYRNLSSIIALTLWPQFSDFSLKSWNEILAWWTIDLGPCLSLDLFYLKATHIVILFFQFSYPWASRKKLKVPTSQQIGSSRSAQGGNNKHSILTGLLPSLKLLSLNNFIKIAVVLAFLCLTCICLLIRITFLQKKTTAVGQALKFNSFWQFFWKYGLRFKCLSHSFATPLLLFMDSRNIGLHAVYDIYTIIFTILNINSEFIVQETLYFSNTNYVQL